MYSEVLPSEFYKAGESDRQPFLDRAQKYAEYTIPHLLRDSNANGQTKTPDVYGQSFFARLVETLKGKVGLALFPPATASFKLEPDSTELEQLAQSESGGDAKAYDSVINGTYELISKAVAKINKEVEAQNIRPEMFSVIEHAICVGTVLIEKIKNNGIIFHPLDTFILDTNSDGEMKAFCIHELTKELPDGVKPSEDMPEDGYDLYTMGYYDHKQKKWVMRQEVNGQIFNEQTINEDKLQFELFGWSYSKGDKYYRPYVEKYFASMDEYSTLNKVIVEGSIASAKVLFFVDQRGGRTSLKDVADSENLAVLQGRAEDVSVLNVGKNYDFQIPYEMLKDIKRELASAFLMNESATRQAERVTAEEIRFMAQELESSTLSGVYSTFANKSKRIISWIIQEMGIDLGSLSLNMIVGLDAIGRSNEARSLDSFMQRVSSLGYSNIISPREVVMRYASFDNVETTRLVKTSKQLEAEQKAQQEAMIAQQGAMASAQSGGQEAGKAMAQQAMA